MSPPTSLGMCLSGQGIALIFVASTEKVSCGGCRMDEPENHTALPCPSPRLHLSPMTPPQLKAPPQPRCLSQLRTPPLPRCPLQHRTPPQSSGSTPTRGSTPVWGSTLVGRLCFYASVFLSIRWYIWRSEVLQNQLEQLEMVHGGK